MEKVDKKRSIGEVAKELGLETHVIRFWESKFPQIKPQIGKGDRRYYFDKEVAILNKIKSLLHDEGYSIAGLQKLLNRRKDVRAKKQLKEQNIEGLVKEDLFKNQTNERDFSIDDFIDPEVDVVLESDAKDLKNLIEKIESNLTELEACLK